jgi:hypothetical protein
MLLLSTLFLTFLVFKPVPITQGEPAQPLTLHSEKPLVPIHMHTMGLMDLYNPLQTPFHELYPEFCQNFMLTSWEDVNQDGYLSGGDQIDMVNNTGGETHWYYVDRLTFTLYITKEQSTNTMYIEFKGPYNLTILESPICTLWHEVWPVYCPIFHIKNWQDTGTPYGRLSYCDWIQFDDDTWWHVEQVATDLILNEKITDPVCTYWNELHPVFGNRYHIIEWIDNGDQLLSPSDNVYLDPGPIMPYSVKDVTLTLFVSFLANPAQTMYIEFTGGFQHLYEPKTNPLGTLWHEVYPEYCLEFEIIDWIDNCNGVLSYCDNITLFDLSSQQMTVWHVEELAIDITVQEPVHDVAVISVTPLFASVFQGYPNPITVVVSNDGDFTETFNVDVKYGGTHVTTSPITVTNLPPKTSKQLIFCWVTKNVPPNTYTISAYANPVPGETDLADNNMTDGTVTILSPPPFYWKEGFCDYAPSGVPDFDQKQGGTYIWKDQFGAWSHCGPVAVANSLWWLDSKFEPAKPPVTPPAVSDGFPLVRSYATMPPFWDDHDSKNVPWLVEHLAYLMDTDGRRTGLVHSGTYVNDMEAGLAQYLSWTGVNPLGDVNGDGVVNNTDVNIVNAAMGSAPGMSNWNMAADIFPITLGWPRAADNVVNAQDLKLVTDNLNGTGFFYERTVSNPDYYFIEEEVEKSEDVVLLIGYWRWTGSSWYREGGHYLTVAGVNSAELKIAVSDPCLDAFENGLIPEGRVPIPHTHMPPEPPYTTHNDAAYVSHDIYNVALISQLLPMAPPNPNGTWTLVNYAGWQPTPPYFAVIESAVITSPLGIHDVAVTNVTSMKTVICQGYTGNITVKAENQGDFPETFNVTLYANTTAIKTTEVTLPSKSSTSIIFVWNASGFVKGNYTLWAYAWPVLGETETADNNFTDKFVFVSMVGDLTGSIPNVPDGKVETKDVAMVSQAFGCLCVNGRYVHSPPCPKCPHNPNTDINNDGKVETKDVAIVSKQFGQIDP